MVDVFMIVSICIFSVLLLGGVIIMLIRFGHPDDKNEAWFPRIIALLSFWLAFACILILPYDRAANAAGQVGKDSGINVALLWQIAFITLACFVCAVIPFAYFFYESDSDPEDKGCCASQLSQAICYSLCFTIAFVIICVILYASGINSMKIPYSQYTVAPSFYFKIGDPASDTRFYEAISNPGGFKDGGLLWCRPADECNSPNSCDCVKANEPLAVDATFPVFIICFLSFVGWFFWIFFVSVGFVALPMDLINSWRTRPQAMPTRVYFDERHAIGERAAQLLDIAEKLQRKDQDTKYSKSGRERWRVDNDLRKFERAFYFLKTDYEMLEMARKLRDQNPLIPFFALVIGIISGILSLAWLVHVGVFVLPNNPPSPMLNAAFRELDSSFTLLGVAFYALFSYYLMWCVIKGNFKLGIRFAFVRIFPMEVGKTKMNAFLANAWVLLLCTIPTIQFCAIAFSDYAAGSDAQMLLGTQLKYMKFFKYFWENNAFIIAMLCLAFLAILYFFTFPSDKSKKIEKELMEFADRRARGEE